MVENDRPFSEILTADYTMINPYSAMLYETDAAFENPLDEDEFVEARVTIAGADGPQRIPHAGVLTSPMFLNRFPTTPTNRSRHRARKVYELFLATDILLGAARFGGTDGEALARPIDPGSLALDDAGMKITPELVHVALRRVAGIADHELSARYPLPGDAVPLFGGALLAR